MCRDVGGYRCVGHGRKQMCEDMGGYRGVGTWEDTESRNMEDADVCEDIGRCRCVGTFDDADEQGHGRM